MENGVSYIEGICIAIINKALSGDTKAFDSIRNIIEAEPMEKDKQIVMPTIHIIGVKPENKTK